MTERFDDDKLRAAYQAARPAASGPAEALTSHGAECPGPDALLAAMRGEGAEAERLHVLDRAMRCPACRRELALLHAITPPPRPHGAVVGRTWTRLAPLAAAAVIVLAVGLFGVNRWRQSPDDAAVDTDVVRAAGAEPVLLGPAATATLGAGAIPFVWRPVSGAFEYTLEVDAADGTVLFTATTADTALVAPLGSVTHGEHRWSVRARLDDGSERRSESRRVRLQ